MKRLPVDCTKRMSLFGSMLSTWLKEVESEVSEAEAILSDSDGSNMWWADRIRHRLVDNSPPDAGISADDQASTLIEIAFWSGWLKGELDTLQRSQLAFSSVTAIGNVQQSLPVSFDNGNYSETTEISDEYNRHRNEAERLLGKMDSMNFIPGADMVSIHLGSVLDDSKHYTEGGIERDCGKALEDFSVENSMKSLVDLSFNAGMLAGLLAKERTLIRDLPAGCAGEGGKK